VILVAAKQTSNSPKRKKKPAGRRYGPGRPTSQDLEQRKTRIIEIATALFLEKGFAETSLVDVAKQSGVATRTIYQHYGNKEDIFRAVLDTNTMGKEPDLPEIDSSASLFDALFSTAHFIFAYTLSGESLPILRLMAAESQRFPDLMRQTFEILHDRLHGSVIEIFERLEAEGKIPAGNHPQSVKYFIDLLLGNAPMQLNMNWIKSGPSEEEIRDKIALFIAGRFGIKPDAKTTVSAGKKKAQRKTAKRKV
jgi:TetR/AcrR family transcriptional regulator, mexJK operon transcriptional repressor